MALSSHNGYLDGSGESMYAAHADHSHDADYAAKDHNHDDDYAAKDHTHAGLITVDSGCYPVQVSTATIETTDWSEGSATVPISGTFVGALCSDSSVSVSGVTAEGVVFSADETPGSNVDVSIFSIPSNIDLTPADEGGEGT